MLRRLFLLSILPPLLLPGPAEARCRRPVAAEASLEAVPSAPAAHAADTAEATGGAGSADAAASEITVQPAPGRPVKKRPSPGASPAPSEIAAAPAPAAEPPAPPVPTAPAPTPAPAAMAETYAVSPGETLRTALTRWTAAGGWELVWDAPNDYTLSAGAGFGGGLVPAVTQLMESLRANGAPFGAELFEGNRVVRVTRNR